MGYAKLGRDHQLRIAAGEEESERKSFLQLMDVGKIDVVQVDLTRCGGFTEAIKIAALAADRGLPIVNHGFTTYLNVAAALHFLASIPNTLGLLEFVVEEGTTLRHQSARRFELSTAEWPYPTRRASASRSTRKDFRSSVSPEPSASEPLASDSVLALRFVLYWPAPRAAGCSPRPAETLPGRCSGTLRRTQLRTSAQFAVAPGRIP